MPEPESHSTIIINEITRMAGASPNGGYLQTLRGYCDTIASIENNPNRSDPMEAVLVKSEQIADKLETNGFTAVELEGDTGELGTLIAAC